MNLRSSWLIKNISWEHKVSIIINQRRNNQCSWKENITWTMNWNFEQTNYWTWDQQSSLNLVSSSNWILKRTTQEYHLKDLIDWTVNFRCGIPSIAFTSLNLKNRFNFALTLTIALKDDWGMIFTWKPSFYKSEEARRLFWNQTMKLQSSNSWRLR